MKNCDYSEDYTNLCCKLSHCIIQRTQFSYLSQALGPLVHDLYKTQEHVIGKSTETMKTHLFYETMLLEVSDSCPPYDIVKGCSDWLNRWCSLAVSSSLITIETSQLLFTAINLASVVLKLHVT